jgi:hypothetical protein
MISEPRKIEGKTYSLFGNKEDTVYFFSLIDSILDNLLTKYADGNDLLILLRDASKKRRYFVAFEEDNIGIADIKKELRQFTPGVEEHLKQQSFFRFSDGVMKLKEWQYHMYMLEFALVNRLNREKFCECRTKIALLPHCLRYTIENCKAESDDTDLLCKYCSPKCYINEISVLLKEKDISPYIWMSANLKKIIKSGNPAINTIGILGIACIPELINGMRSCFKKGIPVVGMPLDANRCARWMGDFYPNSINLDYLKTIIN